MDNKIVHVIGGGTTLPIRTHVDLMPPGYEDVSCDIGGLGANAYGQTAKEIERLCYLQNSKMDIVLSLTKMANPWSSIKTNDDLRLFSGRVVRDPRTKIVFFNTAVCDFIPSIDDVESGKYAERLRTSDDEGEPQEYWLKLTPAPKIINLFRRGMEGCAPRKDIFLVGFKETAGKTPQQQYQQGLRMLKTSSANLVLANDVVTRNNMVIVPEEAIYHETTDRLAALKGLVEMAHLRSHLTFTRSTPGPAEPIPWDSELIPQSLRTIVDYCIERGAYKKFLGVTAGHFAAKVDDTTFLTSIRKTDFNDIKHNGLVKIKTDGPDTVIAFGPKPSVGGQSQRIVFGDHKDIDCVVHFHCPIKAGSKVPVVSQREFECGSHECGHNTSRGMQRFGNLLAVHLDQHGPNIGFDRSVDPQEVINFIEANFDLESKTGGYDVA